MKRHLIIVRAGSSTSKRPRLGSPELAPAGQGGGSWLGILCLVLCLVCWLRGGVVAGAETPRRGGTLRLGFPSELRSLDPAISFDVTTIPLSRLLFRCLLDYDEGTGLVPDEARDWNISTDGKTYTFHLRPNLLFAHGRAVEAADYVFALERVLDPKAGSPGQTYFLDILGAREYVAGKAAHVSGLRAVDPLTLVIELSAPVFVFRYVLTMGFASAVPRELVQDATAQFSRRLVGSGPYRLAEWRRGIRWVFERNPYYAGEAGWVDRVEVMIGGDDAARSMMLERGELDQVVATPAQAAIFQHQPGRRSWLVGVDTANTDYLFLNVEMKPFDDPRVRQAVCHAVNKPRLLKLAGGFGSVARGVVPPFIGWTNGSLPHYEYDPAKARLLLRQAGYPDGFRTELWYIVDTRTYARLAEGVEQDLRQVGIQAVLKPASYTAFQAKAQTRRQVPCGVWGWVQDYPDPSDFLDVLLNGERITETDCNNGAFYNNLEVNRRLNAAARSLAEQERAALFREAEALVLRDAPWVPLIHEQVPVLYHPRVHGTAPHPVWLWRYEKMWLAHERP